MERLQLIERLWESLSPSADVEVTAAQRAELKRRDEAFREGSMKTYSEEETFEALRRRARG
jgi:putative addiction module component (TIGR02574 family)